MKVSIFHLNNISFPGLYAKSLFSNVWSHAINKWQNCEPAYEIPSFMPVSNPGRTAKLVLNLTCNMPLILSFWVLHFHCSFSPLRNKFSLKLYIDLLLKCLQCPSISPSLCTLKSLVLIVPSFLLWWWLGCALNRLSSESILDAGGRGTLFWFPLSLLKF